MKKLQAVTIAIGLPLVALAIVWGVSSIELVQAAPPARPLYDPGDCVVTSTNDSGAGSLRSCMAQLAPGDTITFSTSVFPPTNPATITLSNPLPIVVTNSITIDGSSAGVILDGSGIGTTPVTVLLDDVSLTLDGGPELISNGDFGVGLGHWRPWDDGPGATRSLNSSDFTSPPNAYEWDTVAHTGSSNTIYDTTDTSDPFDGGPFDVGSTAWISTTGGSTAELRFWYKYVGPAATLRALFPDGYQEYVHTWWFDWQNDWTEMVITETVPAEAIAISLEFKLIHWEMSTNGLVIDGANNVVIKGLQILNFPNNGIELRNGASNNTIGGLNGSPGGACTGDCNLISGNSDAGVDIGGGIGTTMNNTVSGNYIGTDVNGTTELGNVNFGIYIGGGAQHTLIGGDTPGGRNLISGNHVLGVKITDSGTMSNTVSGNYIGTDASGTSALGNGRRGVKISDGASNNTVGGSTASERNIISGNGTGGSARDGIQIEDLGTMNNVVSGNYIGTNASGTAAIGNNGCGVDIRGGATRNLISHNLISHNQKNGVLVDGGGTLSNTISQNSIYSNAGAGINLVNGGNLELPPPILTHVDTNSVKGLAPPNSTVEIFSDAEDEGRYFHGSILADASGDFTFTQASAFTGTNVTATATDGDGNTSEFSAPYEPIYLPIILKNH